MVTGRAAPAPACALSCARRRCALPFPRRHPVKRHGILQRSYSPPDHALAQRVSHSAAVSLLGVALRAVITIGSTAILARLLSPADFGLLTMASLVTEFAALFSNFGIGAILIQSRRTFRLQYDTAFWFAAALGVLLTAAVWVFSGFAGLFFDDPRVATIVRVLSVLFLLEELTVVHSAVLNRLLKFKLEVGIQIAQLVLRVGTTILFAWLGWGVWALVLGSLLGAVFRTLALWMAVPYRPRPRFHFAVLQRRLRMGLSFLGSAVLGYFSSNLDYLVVGRRFGATELGYYQAAYSLSDELRNRLSLPLQRVLFPAYSLVQNDLERFRNGVLTAARLLSVATFPLAAGMSATAPELVALLYGERWLPVVPLLQVLAINGAIRSLISMVGPIFAARDRMHVALGLHAVAVLVTLLLVLVGAQWGARGVAIGMLFSTATGVLSVYIAMGYLDLRLRHFAIAIGPAAVCAAVMAGSVVAARPLIEVIAQDTPLRLLTLVCLGAAIYAIAMATISPGTIRLCLDTLRRLR